MTEVKEYKMKNLSDFFEKVMNSHEWNAEEYKRKNDSFELCFEYPVTSRLMIEKNSRGGWIVQFFAIDSGDDVMIRTIEQHLMDKNWEFEPGNESRIWIYVGKGRFNYSPFDVLGTVTWSKDEDDD